MPEFFTNQDWEPLVELLREEVQEYGQLHNLLSAQQEHIIERKAEAVLAGNDDIDRQVETLSGIRRRREAAVAGLAGRAGLPGDTPLSEVTSRFPEYVRPLLEALGSECNEMIRRTRHKARQNHLLLSRTLHLTQEALRALKPELFSQTYASSGKVALGGPLPPRYHAVG
ncbi:MAG: flagellar protein FlgN [Puniceicoccaceae bacterium]|nr:MAG: flagellar protein FlgN [Puniceicoccaceae bacterium]